ncbi:hypothetical protein C8Q73DRAFT_213218 [Cubamyces lactineus]|nr:hypothetical protein C8Q73DRAFT_213218 [Cubamyces lactineus]
MVRSSLASIMASRFLLAMLEITRADEDTKYRTEPGAIFSTVRLSDDDRADSGDSIAYISPSISSVDDVARVSSLPEEGAYVA